MEKLEGRWETGSEGESERGEEWQGRGRGER